MRIVGIKELLWTYHPLPKNIEIVPFSNKSAIESADILLQTNIKGGKKEKKIGNIYQYVIDSGKPYICVESAVFRRNMPIPPNPMSYHRWSWFSYYRDEGNYNNFRRPDDRWKRVQQEQRIEIKDWKTTGEYILLILQRPGDTSLRNLINKHGSYENFITDTIKNIRRYTDRPIKVRMHPLRRDVQKRILAEIGISKMGIIIGNEKDDLYKDFKDAKVVVGFNSNALTESVCEGIPTFSLCPSSMAWECSNKDLSMLENPMNFNRTQWLNDLAYCQWREDECLAGLPINHLLEIFKEIKK